MPVFHADQAHATAQRTQHALTRLGEQLEALRARAVDGMDFERLERDIHALFSAAEREVLGEELLRLDVDLPHVFIDAQRHQRVLSGWQTYTTAVGPVRVHRTLYRRTRDERSMVPMELRAGIVEGHWTALAAR